MSQPSVLLSTGGLMIFDICCFLVKLRMLVDILDQMWSMLKNINGRMERRMTDFSENFQLYLSEIQSCE